MNQTASAQGAIIMHALLSAEEKNKIASIFEKQFIITFHDDLQTNIHLSHNAQNWERDLACLNALNTAFPNAIECGYINYQTDERTFWRLVYKPTGQWVRQNGTIVYEDDDVFGQVEWHIEDIHDAMEHNSYCKNLIDSIAPIAAPTFKEELVANILNACQHHSFTDRMIEAGWETLYDIIYQEAKNMMLCQSQEKENY